MRSDCRVLARRTRWGEVGKKERGETLMCWGLLCIVELVDVVTTFVVIAGRFVLFAAGENEVRAKVVAMSSGGGCWWC